MPSLFLLLGRWSFCCSNQRLRRNEVVISLAIKVFVFEKISEISGYSTYQSFRPDRLRRCDLHDYCALLLTPEFLRDSIVHQYRTSRNRTDGYSENEKSLNKNHPLLLPGATKNSISVPKNKKMSMTLKL